MSFNTTDREKWIEVGNQTGVSFGAYDWYNSSQGPCQNLFSCFLFQSLGLVNVRKIIRLSDNRQNYEIFEGFQTGNLTDSDILFA
jgi:hypothetical protein